ncbi:MAG: lipoprotein insertase outer membrane protein LolB [Pasteurellaceae bacterium]|nr:lipoprotein insertase outer membrane protein LolB [Pasteurellaceae bacterium]
MKTFYRFLSLGIFVVLTGCHSIYNAPTEVAKPAVEIPHTDAKWQQHLAQLQQIKGYTAKGQFGYISPEKRFSSHFDWQYQTPTQFSLTMSSNLSSKSLKLQRNVRGITVSDSEGRSRTETDVNKLMQEIIGVSFPIDQFAYWVKGQPEQGSQYIINEKRQLSQFNYAVNGTTWKATFVEYHEDRQPNLPKLIVLENGKQTLKIRVDQWVY